MSPYERERDVSLEKIVQNSLVLYKHRPARVVATGERLEIELEDGNRARVRPKDVWLLHPGPLMKLQDLQPLSGDIELAWELLQGGDHTLADLAELVYREYTPASAWAAWQWVEDGLYLHGTPDALLTRTPEEVEQLKLARKERLAEQVAWAQFLERARKDAVSPKEDCERLRELQELALGRRKDCRLLRELGKSERSETAHSLLLQWGCWDYTVDPYPGRFGVTTLPPEFPLPELPDEPRLDLTGLEAYAIDDRENQDPDDAISLESCQIDEAGVLQSARLWVHVADAAALVTPDSPADIEARQRGATLYLPEGNVPMLPPQALARLGIGLQTVSPALSFGIEMLGNGEIDSLEIKPSLVRAQRFSYEQAEARLQESPLRELWHAAQVYQARRRANGAYFIDMPEAIIHVVEGVVEMRLVLPLRSRELVREVMLMAGEAVARYAAHNAIPFPFATQAPPAQTERDLHQIDAAGAQSLSRLYAVRRLLQRSQTSTIPTPHSGVGLLAYSRVTSPLRRYLDLAAHQQLRQHLSGQSLISEQGMLERLGTSEAASSSIAQVEWLARRHWTLVYLIQHPGWQGEGVLVEKHGSRGRVLIPELALETQVHLREDLPLDTPISLKLKGVNLAELEAYF